MVRRALEIEVVAGPTVASKREPFGLPLGHPLAAAGTASNVRSLANISHGVLRHAVTSLLPHRH